MLLHGVIERQPGMRWRSREGLRNCSWLAAQSVATFEIACLIYQSHLWLLLNCCPCIKQLGRQSATGRSGAWCLPRIAQGRTLSDHCKWLYYKRVFPLMSVRQSYWTCRWKMMTFAPWHVLVRWEFGIDFRLWKLESMQYYIYQVACDAPKMCIKPQYMDTTGIIWPTPEMEYTPIFWKNEVLHQMRGAANSLSFFTKLGWDAKSSTVGWSRVKGAVAKKEVQKIIGNTQSAAPCCETCCTGWGPRKRSWAKMPGTVGGRRYACVLGFSFWRKTFPGCCRSKKRLFLLLNNDVVSSEGSKRNPGA